MVTHEQLNASFSDGGEIELNEAITLYGQNLMRYCHNILCDYHEAEDVVQMTFVKAYQKRHEKSSGAWGQLHHTSSRNQFRNLSVFP